MPKEYRSRSRIVMDLLRAVRDEEPAGVTRLLFLANLSNDRLKEYLGELNDKGWIEAKEEGGRSLWHITPEGHRVLGELDRVRRVMEDFGLGL